MSSSSPLSSSSPSSPLPNSMSAWLKHRSNPSPVLSPTHPVPSCPAKGFLIRIHAAGICHSDVKLVSQDTPDPYFSRESYILGHEGCGKIVAIGEKVSREKQEAFKLGDLVSINPVPGCGNCSDCARELPHLCTEGLRHGLGRDGSFAEFIAVESDRAIVKVPEGVPPRVAAIATDAVMTAYHAVVRRGQVRKGETVFVFGVGGLGSNAVQVLLHLGARVLVSDLREGSLEWAVEVGVKREDVVPVGESVKEWVRRKGLGEGGIDAVIDFVGLEQSVEDGIAIVRRGGRIVSVGLMQREVKLNQLLCVSKRISLLYSFGGLSEDLEESLDLIARGVLTPRTETAPMATFPEALRQLHEGKIKGRIVMIPEGIDQKV